MSLYELESLKYALECHSSENAKSVSDCERCLYSKRQCVACDRERLFRNAISCVKELILIEKKNTLKHDILRLKSLIGFLGTRNAGEVLSIGRYEFNTDEACDEIIKALKSAQEKLQEQIDSEGKPFIREE